MRKWIVVVIVVLAFLLMSFTTNKANKLKDAVSKLGFGIHSFRTAGIKGWGGFWLRFHLLLRNPTGYDFSVTPNGNFQPKTIRVYLDNVLAGFATIPDLKEISLKAGETATIENVDIDVNAYGAGSKLMDMYLQNDKDFMKLFPKIINRLSFEIDFVLLGEVVTIKQTL